MGGQWIVVELCPHAAQCSPLAPRAVLLPPLGGRDPVPPPRPALRRGLHPALPRPRRGAHLLAPPVGGHVPGQHETCVYDESNVSRCLTKLPHSALSTLSN